MASFDPKVLKKVLKEGGKRAVEIVGVAETGGLEFFCTKLDEPEGNVDLLVESLGAMNKPVDPNEEESKGGSGDIGKMLFSVGDHQLAVVAYVPKDKQDKLTAKVWLENVLSKYEGEIIEAGDEVATGIVKANKEKEVFPLKVRDVAIPTSIDYLRSQALFPPAAEDSDSDMVFGDDFDPDEY